MAYVGQTEPPPVICQKAYQVQHQAVAMHRHVNQHRARITTAPSICQQDESPPMIYKQSYHENIS